VTPVPGEPVDPIVSRVEATLLRCADLSHQGRYRKVLTEVEKTLTRVGGRSHLKAHLLIWKAQALVAMGFADRAWAAASQSWELESTPHACHLMANALCALGEADQAEDLLRVGWRLFPDAVHLPVQLAMLLADQGRLPEAELILGEIDDSNPASEEVVVFVVGLRASILANMGRWAEAEEVLESGLALNPDCSVLEEAHLNVREARRRQRAEEALLASWSKTLEKLEGVASEVDDATRSCGAITEMTPLVTLAARRLWRSFLAARRVRPAQPDAWGAALVLAVLEIDGTPYPVASFARATQTNVSTVRSALRSLRGWLESLDSRVVQRAFAASTNSRLSEGQRHRHRRTAGNNVVPFPTP
jgi:tetratricopeptide (TPR) repeat protein